MTVLHSGDETCNIYLVFSVFTSRPASLLASNTASVPSYETYVFDKYIINIISTDQQLMYYIQFQPVLIFLDLSDGVF
jgi:hypothetical protein